MTDPQVAMLMLSLFIFLVLLGFPIAFTLIAMGVGLAITHISKQTIYLIIKFFIYLIKILIP